jgi:hypothetical protein
VRFDQRGLRRPVVDRTGVRLEEGVDRCGVDDRATTVFEHRGQDGACGSQRREEVHLQRPLELVVAGAEKSLQPQADSTDVVHEDVNPSVFVEGALDQLGRPVRGAEVQSHAGHALEALESVGASGPGHHEGALLDQRPRHREADPLTRACYDRDPIRELQVQDCSY